MNILVVAATGFEIEPFISENTYADVLITGVGMPATVYNLTKKIFEKKYDVALQAGIGGTFSDAYPLASVAAIIKDAFGDLGIQEKNTFNTLFDAGFINRNDYPFQEGWLVNENKLLKNLHLNKAAGITINKITDDANAINKLNEKFNAGIESMEGAAFHYVCLLQKVNFLQLRSISNVVGERDKSKWKIREAIANLNIELEKIIKNIYT